jgi:hypothetical protein
MMEVGTRRRTQAPPPHVVFEALTNPDRDATRPWLRLLRDEQRPDIVHADFPTIVWSSLWPRRPDATIRFDVDTDGGCGTRLRWTLLVAEPIPDQSLLGHLRKRLKELINADLRASFDQ